MTPLQYQKRLRLHAARALLVTRPDDIAGVGHDVGYASPSQFSREYRRMFGRPPGQDVAALRERAGAAADMSRAQVGAPRRRRPALPPVHRP
jgi:transcriptional regulator GlxA family with amidase domain